MECVEGGRRGEFDLFGPEDRGTRNGVQRIIYCTRQGVKALRSAAAAHRKCPILQLRYVRVTFPTYSAAWHRFIIEIWPGDALFYYEVSSGLSLLEKNFLRPRWKRTALARGKYKHLPRSKSLYAGANCSRSTRSASFKSG